MTTVQIRKVPLRAALMLEQAGVSPLLARLWAARGISEPSAANLNLSNLLHFESMKGAEAAACLLADHILSKRRILIVADYDCDGATACAVGLRTLRQLGASVDYLVPNRLETGYGLSPEVVRLAECKQPDLLITVDNGISSVEGIALANQLGMVTVVTDHHLPGDELPDAKVIVNPNQPGCRFPSKAIAGVGVMFFVMLATRAELRRRQFFANRPEPNLAQLLDLVALGTVADVVPLDHNNRILVSQGLARMRQQHMQSGIAALFAIAGRNPATASTFDLGFAIGPRINAAGRLADMSLGIEGLTCDDAGRAHNIAMQLDAINRERRSIEAEMQEAALIQLEDIDAQDRASLSLFNPDWHQGVIGILAGRVKEAHHRPTFVFARGTGGELKASGRSIPGLHLRDALDLLAKRRPHLIRRFGGHAAAAGLSIAEADLEEFSEEFEAVARSLLTPEQLQRTVMTDGSLETGYRSLQTARLLQGEIWGQGFPAPLFFDSFEVESQKLLKEKHLKLSLLHQGARYDAIQFNSALPAAGKVKAAYRLDVNEWNGVENLQLLIEHLEPA